MSALFYVIALCAFTFGVVSLTVSFTESLRVQNSLLKVFTLFFLSYSVYLFSLIVSGFLMEAFNDESPLLMEAALTITLFGFAQLLFSISAFPLYLASSRVKKQLTLVFALIFIAYAVVSRATISWDAEIQSYTVPSFINPLYFILLITVNFWAAFYGLYSIKNAGPQARPLLKTIVPVLLCFLPLWGVDALFNFRFSRFFSLALYVFFAYLLLRTSRGVSITTNRASADNLVELLSEREREVLTLILSGADNKQIGEAMFISVNTVKTHIKKILKKTGAKDRFTLLLALRHHPQG